MIGFTMVLPWFFTMVLPWFLAFISPKSMGNHHIFRGYFLIYRKHNLPRVKPRCQYVISFKNGVMQKTTLVMIYGSTCYISYMSLPHQ